MNKDKSVGLILVAIAIVVAIATINMSTSRLPVSGDPGAKLMPYICSIILGVCGVGIFFQSKGKGKRFLTKQGWINCLGIFVICLFFVLLLKPAGYLISSAIGMFLLVTWIVYAKDGKENIKPVAFLTFSVITTLLLYLFFTKVLNVVLPKGILYF
ncbi:MAG: tripartite tricarboxylate transporter TctB family protein [Clostridiales bacterium]|nr:tripartite tricarboxylate transporter TctB family protein [Clostridiales bacterium]